MSQDYRSFQSVLDFADDLNALIQENEDLKAEIYYLQEQVEHYRNAYNELVATNNEGFVEIFNALLSNDCRNNFLDK